MSDKKILKILAAIFALRAKYWNNEAKRVHDQVTLGNATAYENAFEMLSYAAMGWVDELRQFGWSDEAETLINEVGEDVDFYKILELVRQRPL